MTIEKDFFRQVMGHFATGVTVVTTGNQNTIGGLTVNAFCSVSLNPPLVLICVDLQSTTLPLIRESGVFAVNMLTEQQEQLSRCFATPNRDRFESFCNTPYSTAATGAPVLADVLAFIDARIVAEYPGGDHALFLGQVEALGAMGHILFANEEKKKLYEQAGHNGHNMAKNENPLIYHRGQYQHLAEHYSVPSLTVPLSQQSEDV